MKNIAPKKLHDNSRKKIADILKRILINFKDGTNGVALNRIELEKLSREILKNYSEILDEKDINGIVYENFSNFLPNHDLDLFTKRITDISDDEHKSFSNSVLSELDRLPVTYDIYFPLPKLELEKSVEVSSEIMLFVGATLLGTEIGFGNPKTTYLKIQANGYASRDKNQSAIYYALSKMKKFIEIGRLKGIFWTSPFDNALYSLLGQHSIEIIKAQVIESEYPNKVTSCLLDVNISTYLAKIRLLLEWEKLDLLELIKVPQSETINKISTTFNIIDNEEISDNCNGLKRALEWSFDAEADEDEKISFVKKCISLESALGEGNETDSITDRLSDRCAFLVSKTPNERNATRKSIKEIYKLRSKYVHGVIDRFTEENRKSADSCHWYLDKVLNKELDELEHWHEKKFRKNV
ncbi:HEPN domain-containing protein [Janthinobacterium lividum]|uniref:HEPN domain-containing protein n=1 Tax=Janthinobacterium lividum TaxID=29581 RepID=UPI001594F110|nr:HEPN domain-containing protein [Janthinobacterium lividum]QKY09493.1 hypothetical protein G8765_18200 [Janthinobacterium lividum]